ncbi:Phospholipase/carboxylesterase [Cladorrhinum sp. PSN259]|nr:Phospholipase/carboxylesterase [Cladorrhinum sp. PSN259]
MVSINIPTITIGPSERHTHSVVFLHGRGDNARNFASSLSASHDSHGRTLVDAFPSFRWVFPQAPNREFPSSPGTTLPQWFDVWNVRDFAEKEELQAVGLREVIPAIQSILADEAESLGGRWDRIVLAGISMGAATGVHVLFNLDVPPPPMVAGSERKLAAFIGFSCRCPFAGRDLAGMREALGLPPVVGAASSRDHDDVLRNTPALLEHCVDDPLVLVQNGRGLRDTLLGFGMRVEWREYPSGGHWFNSPRGMDDAIRFLQMHVLGEGDTGGTTSSTGFEAPSDAMDLS